jgi:tetraacyldisaccharide 4'-kinase
VSRGYRAKITHYPHQVTIHDTVDAVGDEAFMQFHTLNLPVVIAPDRTKAIEYLLRYNHVDLILSDDGLQHYSMHRDLEIILYDEKRLFGNKLVMPLGPLREPISRCKKASIIICNQTHSNFHFKGKSKKNKLSLSENKHLLKKNLSSKKMMLWPNHFDVRMQAECFVHLKTAQIYPLNTFENQSIIAIAGIGNPSRFFSSLNIHTQIKKSYTFPDHYSFTSEKLTSITNKNSILIMTKKDAVKCQAFAGEEWYYLQSSMRFNDALQKTLFSNIFLLQQPKIL